VVNQANNLLTILPGCANGGNFNTSSCGQFGSMQIGETIAIRYKTTEFGGVTDNFTLAEESRGLVDLYVIKAGQSLDDVSRSCRMLNSEQGSRGRLKVIRQGFITHNPSLANNFCGLKPQESFHLLVKAVGYLNPQRGQVIRPWIHRPNLVQ
jgi:hypothetical protein